MNNQNQRNSCNYQDRIDRRKENILGFDVLEDEINGSSFLQRRLLPDCHQNPSRVQMTIGQRSDLCDVDLLYDVLVGLQETDDVIEEVDVQNLFEVALIVLVDYMEVDMHWLAVVKYVVFPQFVVVRGSLLA